MVRENAPMLPSGSRISRAILLSTGALDITCPSSSVRLVVESKSFSV